MPPARTRDGEVASSPVPARHVAWHASAQTTRECVTVVPPCGQQMLHVVAPAPRGCDAAVPVPRCAGAALHGGAAPARVRGACGALSVVPGGAAPSCRAECDTAAPLHSGTPAGSDDGAGGHAVAAGAPPVQAAAPRHPGAGGAGVGADCTGLNGNRLWSFRQTINLCSYV